MKIASAIAISPTARFNIRAVLSSTFGPGFRGKGSTMSPTIPIDALARQPSAEDITTASIDDITMPLIPTGKALITMYGIASSVQAAVHRVRTQSHKSRNYKDRDRY